MQRLTSRDAFLGAGRTRRFKDIPIPGFGMVRIRSLTERDRQSMDRAALSDSGELDEDRVIMARARLVVAVVVGDDGEPFLTEKDVAALEETDAAITTTIEREAMEHCGLRRGVKHFLSDSGETGDAGSPAASRPRPDGSTT